MVFLVNKYKIYFFTIFYILKSEITLLKPLFKRIFVSKKS